MKDRSKVAVCVERSLLASSIHFDAFYCISETIAERDKRFIDDCCIYLFMIYDEI